MWLRDSRRRLCRVVGREVTLVALPLIFTQFCEAGKLPNDSTKTELIEAVRIYNLIPDDEESAYARAVMEDYAAFCRGGN